MKRAIVTPDKHFPYEDKKAIKVLCQAIELVKPEIYVDLGDTGEWESVSHWQWKKKKRPPLEYQLPFVHKEIEDVNKGMDTIDASLNKAKTKIRHFCEGNHDDWLNRFVEENPYLAKEMLVKNALRLKERGYQYHKIGKMLKIGKINFYHGGNVMYGHHHDIQQSSVTHIDGVKSAWSIGCLKDMRAEANEWLGNRQHNWQHAFAIVDFHRNGNFNVTVHQIVNGVSTVDGKVLKA